MGTEKKFRNVYVTGTLEVAGDATITGSLTNTYGSAAVETVQSVTSTGTTINAYGITKFDTTGPGQMKILLGDPVIGQVKYLTVTTLGGSSTPTLHITVNTTGHVIKAATTAGDQKQLRTSAVGDAATLVGLTTAAWGVMHATSSVSYSTKTT